jgi:hypothetical protein
MLEKAGEEEEENGSNLSASNPKPIPLANPLNMSRAA